MSDAPEFFSHPRKADDPAARDVFDNIAIALREAYRRNVTTETSASQLDFRIDGNRCVICFTQTNTSSDILRKAYYEHFVAADLPEAGKPILYKGSDL